MSKIKNKNLKALYENQDKLLDLISSLDLDQDLNTEIKTLIQDNKKMLTDLLIATRQLYKAPDKRMATTSKDLRKDCLQQTYSNRISYSAWHRMQLLQIRDHFKFKNLSETIEFIISRQWQGLQVYLKEVGVKNGK